MSGLVDRRARIARVRRVEHVQASGAAAAAAAQLQSLEMSAERITELRRSLTAQRGAMPAQMLAAQGELAHRLDLARFGLSDAIVGARAAVEIRNAERLEARVRQESAERLEERAADTASRQADHRAAAQPRPGGRRALVGRS